MIYTERQIQRAYFTYLIKINRRIKAQQANDYVTEMIRRNGLARTLDSIREKCPGIDFLSKYHHICDLRYDQLEQFGLFD